MREERMSEVKQKMKLLFDAQDFFRDPQMEAVIEMFASPEKRNCFFSCPRHKSPDESDIDV